MPDSQSVTPLAHLPTNLRADRHGVHRWYNFIAGFSPEFVTTCIERADDPFAGFLLDPFAGTGTALVQAQAAGLPALGYEVQPFFAEIARAKCHIGYTERHLDRIRELVADSVSARRDPESAWGAKQLEYLRKLVPEKALAQLAACPRQAESLDHRLRPLFRLVVSRVLEHASFSQTDGIYKAPSTRKLPTDVEVAVAKVCATVGDDIASDGRSHVAEVVEVGSQHGVRKGASLAVTSPPYLNNFDFAEMSRMEIYFWNWAKDWSSITEQIRARQLPNTTTVPARSKPPVSDIAYLLPTGTRALAVALQAEVATACRGRSKDYHRLVLPYLAGLAEVIRHVRASLIPAAPFHMVVADSAFYGVHVPLHDFVALIMAEVGFEDVQTVHLRERGDRWVLAKRKNPPSKMGEYWVSGIRPRN